jgi:hypothetical protein
MKSHCIYFSETISAGTSPAAEYNLTQDALSIAGRSYWIRVSAQNALGFGSAGCSVVQDFMVVPLVIYPTSVPIWLASGEHCSGDKYTDVWANEGSYLGQSLIIQVWGLPVEPVGSEYLCTVEFECASDAEWIDSWGDGCEWYDASNCDDATDYRNDDGVDATMVCCVCGANQVRPHFQP